MSERQEERLSPLPARLCRLPPKGRKSVGGRFEGWFEAFLARNQRSLFPKGGKVRLVGR